MLREKKLFPFNFRQALKYRSTEKEKKSTYTGFEHTNIGMRCRCTNGRAIPTDYRARIGST